MAERVHGRRRQAQGAGQKAPARAPGGRAGRIAIVWTLLGGGLGVVPASPASAVASTGTFFPLPPARILDTRTGDGAPVGPLGPAGVLSLVVTGRGGVPAADVTAVVLNLTVVAATAASYLTVWPTGETRPTASNLNYVADQTVPNLVKAKVGAGGRVSLFNAAGSAHVLADVAGWYTGGADAVEGARFTALSPSRVLDTRVGIGAPSGTVGPGATLDLQVAGRGGVPASGVSAVTMNLTVVAPSATSSYLTAWPAGDPRPNASNLNYLAGEVVPNLVVVKVGAGGMVSLYNDTGQTHVLSDVVGWYSVPGGAGQPFESLTPSRVLDTRIGIGGTRLGSGATLNLQVTGRGGVPANGPTAVVLNVTVVGPSAESYLTAWPAGEARPTASNLNYRVGQVVPNLVVVKLGPGGAVSLINDAGQTDVLADVVGWFGVAVPRVVVSRSVTARNFFFAPADVVAPAGSTVVMTFANGGTFTHSFTAPGAGAEQQLDPGGEGVVTFTMPSVPTPFFCRFHQGAGMVGTLTPGAG